MKQKRHTTDQVIGKLRRVDVELGKGKKVPEVCGRNGRYGKYRGCALV
jgi:hypothetical protein